MTVQKPERPIKTNIKNFPAHAQFQWLKDEWYVYFPYSFRVAGKLKQERDYIGTLSEDGLEFIPNRLYKLLGCHKWENRPAENWKDPVKRAQAMAAAQKLSEESLKKEASSLDRVPVPNVQMSVGATALTVAAFEDAGGYEALGEALKEPEDVVHTTNLGAHTAITSDKTYCASYESEDQQFLGKGCLPSPRASEFLQKIGSDSSLSVKVAKAMVRRVQDGSLLAIDGTALPSYSRNINLTKLGKTKEGTFNTQVNISLIVDARTGIPVCYRTYAGNINDISTLSDQRSLWKDIGLKDKKVTFCADRGYLSRDELVSLCEGGFHFLIGSKTNVGFIKKVIDERNCELYEPMNLIGSHMCYGISESSKLKTKNEREAEVTSYVFRSTTRQDLLIKEFKEKVSNFQVLWEKTKSDNEKEELRKSPLFEFFNELNGGLILDKRKCNDECYLLGFFAMVGNEGKSVEEVLDMYSERNTVEVDFKRLFGTLLQSTRVHSSQAFEGLMLTTFVGLTMLTRISSKMKETIPCKSSENGRTQINSLYTLPELLRDFRRIKLTYDETGSPRLLNVTQRDRDIVKALGFSGLFDDAKRIERLLSADALVEKLSKKG